MLSKAIESHFFSTVSEDGGLGWSCVLSRSRKQLSQTALVLWTQRRSTFWLNLTDKQISNLVRRELLLLLF